MDSKNVSKEKKGALVSPIQSPAHILIQVSKNYRLASDSTQYLLKKYCKSKKRWVSKYFYTSLEHALLDLQNILTRKCGAKSIPELIQRVKEIKQYIYDLTKFERFL